MFQVPLNLFSIEFLLFFCLLSIQKFYIFLMESLAFNFFNNWVMWLLSYHVILLTNIHLLTNVGFYS